MHIRICQRIKCTYMYSSIFLFFGGHDHILDKKRSNMKVNAMFVCSKMKLRKLSYLL